MSTTSANLGDSRLEPRLPRRPVEQTGLVEDDAAVAAEEGGIRQLDLVARAPDLEDGAHAEVAQLPLDVGGVEGVGRLGGVWLDAADKVLLRHEQRCAERAERLAEDARDGGRA